MNCAHCGTPLVCQACHRAIEIAPQDDAVLLQEIVSRAAPPPSPGPSDDQSVFLIVARGHHSLYEQLKALVGEMGRVQVIEDRRRDRTLLPREGREGAPL